MTDSNGDGLSVRIQELEKELESLRLQQKSLKQEQPSPKRPASSIADLPLELHEYVRYGRQMIIPQIGLRGQLALKGSSVLVIGAGGLGCPVLLYLVAAGIGSIPLNETNL
jgi:adenylyltransferase/sulfurtransferase